MLPAVGCVTASAKAVATAASTALPPRRRISAPTSDARALADTTMPFLVRTGCELVAELSGWPTTSSASPRLASSLAAMGNGLDAFHDSQKVAAQNLLDIAFRVAAFQQRVGQPRQLRHVVHSQRHGRTVEVRAETDMIDAGYLHRVIDVIDDGLPGHPRESARRHQRPIEIADLQDAAGL